MKLDLDDNILQMLQFVDGKKEWNLKKVVFFGIEIDEMLSALILSNEYRKRPSVTWSFLVSVASTYVNQLII